MEALWIKLADGIPAVAVTLIFFLVGYFVVYPIVKLIVERFIPLADRIVLVLEVHGKSSQQLAEVLQQSLSDQRELFELHMKEKLEDFAMLEDRIRTLEKLLADKDKRIAALEREINELKETNTAQIEELKKELQKVRAERDALKVRLDALEASAKAEDGKAKAEVKDASDGSK